jgi:uncharacterized membrane protein YtjA (UPF0391 family)
MEFNGCRGEFIRGKEHGALEVGIHSEENEMGLFHWAFVCLFGAIVAGVSSYTGVPRTATGIPRYLFGLFLVGFLILLLLGFLLSKPLPVVNYGP